jgi:small subunit ribosomal protein S16
MLMIRLFRVGKKKQPSYKIVVTDKKNAPSRGRFVEEVGFYNPLTKQINVKNERIVYWLSVGAKASDTVHNLLVVNKVIEGEKRKIAFKKKEVVAEEKKPEVATPEVKAEEVKTEEPIVEEIKTEEVKTEEVITEEAPVEPVAEEPVA